MADQLRQKWPVSKGEFGQFADAKAHLEAHMLKLAQKSI